MSPPKSQSGSHQTDNIQQTLVRMWRKKNSAHCFGGYKLSQLSRKTVWRSLKSKKKNRTTHNPTFMCMYKGNDMTTLKMPAPPCLLQHYSQQPRCAAKMWVQPTCPQADEWVKRCDSLSLSTYLSIMEYYLVKKEEENHPAICINMDGP